MAPRSDSAVLASSNSFLSPCPLYDSDAMAFRTDRNPESLWLRPVSDSRVVTASRARFSYCIRAACTMSISVFSVSGFVGFI